MALTVVGRTTNVGGFKQVEKTLVNLIFQFKQSVFKI